MHYNDKSNLFPTNIINGELLSKQVLLNRLAKMKVYHDTSQEQKLYFARVYNDALMSDINKKEIFDELLADEREYIQQVENKKRRLSSESLKYSNLENESCQSKVVKLEQGKLIRGSTTQFDKIGTEPKRLSSTISNSDFSPVNHSAINKPRDSKLDVNMNIDERRSQQGDVRTSTAQSKQIPGVITTKLSKGPQSSNSNLSGANLETPRQQAENVDNFTFPYHRGASNNNIRLNNSTTNINNNFTKLSSGNVNFGQEERFNPYTSSNNVNNYSKPKESFTTSGYMRKDSSKSLSSNRVQLNPVTKQLTVVEEQDVYNTEMQRHLNPPSSRQSNKSLQNIQAPSRSPVRTFIKADIECDGGVFGNINSQSKLSNNALDDTYLKFGAIVVAVSLGTILLFKYSNFGSTFNLSEIINFPKIQEFFKGDSIKNNWMLIAGIAVLILAYPIIKLTFRCSAWEIYQKINEDSYNLENVLTKDNILQKVVEEENMSQENFIKNVWPVLVEFLDNSFKLTKTKVIVGSFGESETAWVRI